MDAFKGKYERTSAENYDEMLKVNQIEWTGVITWNYIDSLETKVWKSLQHRSDIEL